MNTVMKTAFPNPARLLAPALLAAAGISLQARPENWTQLDIQTYAGLTITGQVGNIYSIEYVNEIGSEEWKCLESVMGENPGWFNGVREGEDFGIDPARRVEDVSWGQATAYCAVLTERERAAGRIPAGSSYRLPTDAEWEYACRAGTSTRFSQGEDPDYEQLADYAWFKSTDPLRMVCGQQRYDDPSSGAEATEPLGLVRHARKREGMVPGLVTDSASSFHE